jgi:hypothetical protein
MYHGYTLIDAQLRQYCCDYFSAHFENFKDFKVKLKKPHLFARNVQEKMLQQAQMNVENFQDPIRKDLEAGSENFYLYRCLKKHRWPTLIAILFGIAFFLRLAWYCFGPWSGVVNFIRYGLGALLYNAVPRPLVAGLDSFLTFLGYSGLLKAIDSTVHLLALLIVISLAAYVASYPVYAAVRWMATKLDQRNYKKITGGIEFSVHWPKIEETVTKDGIGTPPAGTGVA